VNEAALGLTPDVLPGQAWVNYPLISESSLDYFAAKRMNTIRVPITWERLQPTLNGALDTTYLGYLVRFILVCVCVCARWFTCVCVCV
jgi:endoglucanase